MKAIFWGFLTLVSIAGCWADPIGDCSDTIKSEVTSPSGRYVATVFERDCGATTDYATHISLREVGDAFDPAEPSRILTVSGRQSISVSWSADTVLSVGLPRANTFKKLNNWKGVSISYR